MLQQQIKTLRIAKGWTQEELAQKIPMTQHALSQIENGKRNITLDVYEQILDILEVTPDFTSEDEDLQSVLSPETSEDYQIYLEALFPSWYIYDEGHLFLAVKDFRSKQGKKIAVVVSHVQAWVLRRLVENEGEYIVQEDYITVLSGKKISICIMKTTPIGKVLCKFVPCMISMP